MTRRLYVGIGVLLLIASIFFAYLAYLVFAPNTLPYKPYKVTVNSRQSIRDITKKLADDKVISSRYVMLLLSKINGADRKIKAGQYSFAKPFSMWQLRQRLVAGRPDQESITIIEGIKFTQLLEQLKQEKDLHHETLHMGESQILKAIGIEKTKAEGWFFPSTYFFMPNANSDLDILRLAHKTMQIELAKAWKLRGKNLPYKTPYDLLIMASLVEKETALSADRGQIAAVFVNRLKFNMRLQTDPSVVYGMDGAYSGHITRADLQRDTPYNTYTRYGLTPTPIALPGRASLEAAANPATSNMLYFVARGDGSSQFSATLKQHQAAVRKYILKKGG